VEQQLFAGAGANVFWTGSGSEAGYVNSYKMLQKPKIFHIYFKEPVDDHLCL
jgi:hypothetical protein